MAGNIYGFEDPRIAHALKQAVERGNLSKISHGETGYPKPRQPSTRIFLGTAKTTITAATGGDVGTDFEVGSGTAYIAKLDTETKILEWMYEDDAETIKMEKTIYNLSDQTIAADTEIAFFCVQDVLGNFWLVDLVDISVDGTGTGTGTDDQCINSIAGISLADLVQDSSPSYALGIDSTGCLVLIPIGTC